MRLHPSISQKEKRGEGMKKRSASDEHLDKPQSELLTDELQKASYASVSRSFGQKMLFDALGARDSSMVREGGRGGRGGRERREGREGGR